MYRLRGIHPGLWVIIIVAIVGIPILLYLTFTTDEVYAKVDGFYGERGYVIEEWDWEYGEAVDDDIPFDAVFVSERKEVRDGKEVTVKRYKEKKYQEVDRIFNSTNEQSAPPIPPKPERGYRQRISFYEEYKVYFEEEDGDFHNSKPVSFREWTQINPDRTYVLDVNKLGYIMSYRLHKTKG